MQSTFSIFTKYVAETPVAFTYDVVLFSIFTICPFFSNKSNPIVSDNILFPKYDSDLSMKIILMFFTALSKLSEIL